MDIDIIEQNIQDLENADTSFCNVEELAMLYIVQDHLKNRLQTQIEDELDDILPVYKKYIDVKQKFQLNQVDDTAVLHYFSLVCQEIKEFLLTLYSGTSTLKERKQLYKMLTEIMEIFS